VWQKDSFHKFAFVEREQSKSMRSYSKRISTFVFLFTLTAAGLSAAPRLGLNTLKVGQINIMTGTNGPNQTVQAYNLGTGTLSLTATPTASWLTASVGSQTSCSQAPGGCYPITIGLNTSGLAGGTYTEYVIVTDPNAVDSPQTITVTVNTAPVPNSVTTYITPVGGGLPVAIVKIFTSGTGITGSVNTQSGGNWLQFLSGTGGLTPAVAPWLIQTATQVGLGPGTYTGTVTISGSSVPSDNKTINVTAIVTTSPIISLDNNAPILLSSFMGGSIQYANVNLSNVAPGTNLNITSASGSASFLKATVSSPGSLLISADPTGLATGVYSGTVTISSNAANNSQIAIPVELTVAPAGQPMILAGGIVNAATFAAEPVSQGDIVSIFGTQFAAPGTAATNARTPLATTLGGTQVLVNGVPAPLYYVSPGQINFQIPYSLPTGQLATVQVTSNGTGGNTRSLSINANSPRLLVFASFISGGYGVIVNGIDGSLTLPTGTNVPGFATHPVKPGETVVVYGVGWGQTTPSVVEGQAAPSTQPFATVSNVSATFGGGFYGRATTGTVAFAGLTPTAVGLYQANVVVPLDAPLGSFMPFSMLVNGIQTNPVYLAISDTGR
jgi:uncharacterized protein (TIGR03437 family)